MTNTDETAKVSSNDTTAGYLNGKLVAGTGITLTENNNGGNETLTIAAAAVSPGYNTEWVLVDKWTATGNTTAISFSSSGDGSQQYNVNGNSDGGYKIVLEVIGHSSTGSASRLEINGGVTNQTSNRHRWTSTGTHDVAGFSHMGLLTDAGAGQYIQSEFILRRSATGAIRVGNINQYSSDGANGYAELWVCDYNDTSTNITSLRIANTSGQFAAGTVIRLYKRAPEAF